MKSPLLAILLATALTGVGASQAQSPHPQPVPLPDREPEQKPPAPEGVQPSATAPATASPAKNDQKSARTFSGRIVKSAAKFRLQEKATNTMYDLEQQDKARPYEGKLVSITGNLASGNTISIETIEPSK